MYANIAHGPTFGGGHDIYVSNDSNKNNSSYSNANHSYNIPAGFADLSGEKNFTCKEIEVYQLLLQ